VSDARARLFVALELPKLVRDALGVWVARLPVKIGRALRPVTAEALHVTLCFLGSQLEEQIGAITATCGVVSAEQEVALTLREPMWLPRRQPRVLAIGLEDEEGALTHLQASLAAALTAGGWYRPEKRPYLAHVTVARVGSTAREEDVRRMGRADLPAAPNLSFRGSRVVLYRSRLQRSGARYEGLASVPLRASRA
jgi:2'-5' RNA ligase